MSNWLSVEVIDCDFHVLLTKFDVSVAFFPSDKSQDPMCGVLWNFDSYRFIASFSECDVLWLLNCVPIMLVAASVLLLLRW